MSKFWIYLKTNVRADLKQGHIILSMFLLLPLFLTFILGFSYRSAFVPESEIEPIEISIQNDDSGEVGAILLDTLSSDDMADYLKITDEDDSDFHIHIQADYSERIEDTLLTIQTKENSSSSEEGMLKQLIMQWQQALLDQEHLMEELATIEDPAVMSTLQRSLEEVSEMNTDSIFTTEMYQSETALTSNQFTAVTGVMYILIMTLSGGAGMSTSKELQGMRKRLGVVPLSPKQVVLFEVATNTVIYTFIVLLFLFIWRLIDSQTFTGNPLFYLVWSLNYTLLFQSIGAALLHMIPDKFSNIVFQGVLMLYMLFGLIPIDKMIGGQIGEFFSQNFVRLLFNQPFYDYMQSGNLLESWPIYIGLVVTSFIIIGLTVRFKQRRELQLA